MIVKLFGIMDLVAAAVFILVQWGFGANFALFVALYLILKSLLFLPDFASVIDLIAGIYLILVIYNIHDIFSTIFIIWLLQKSFFSLFV